MRINKKGFTLVELLAVIVILAVIIVIASSNVGGLMTEARKNTLAIEGNELINSAKNAYQIAVLNGDITTGKACFSLEYLYQGGYFDKGADKKYTGSVLVDPGSEGKIITYTFWISNGSYVVSGKAGTNGKAGTEGATASIDCGADEGAKKFQHNGK